MKILQNNKNNVTGFFQKESTDFGVDENNQTALGYQHHDALWWDGESKVLTDRPAMDFEQTIDFFKDCFSHISTNIMHLYAPKKVLEFGSGSGMLSEMFRERGATTVTVDANEVVKDKSPHIDGNHFWARTDKPLDFTDEEGGKVFFDVVVSLEHFEHIPVETCDVMMENIQNHTKPGAYLIFTAAAWEYDGEQHHVHCNVQTKAYWEQYITRFGFEVSNPPFPLGRAADTWEIFARRV